MKPEPFVKVTEPMFQALVEGGVGHGALMLYLVMSRHVNRLRGDTAIWPSRQTLATAMGLKRADGVDRYIKELVKAGWIAVERRQESRTKTRNRYILRGPSMEMAGKTGLSPSEMDGKTGSSIGGKTGSSMAGKKGWEPEGTEPDELEPEEPLPQPTSSSSSERRRSTTKRDRRSDEQHAKRIIRQHLDATDDQLDALIAWYRDQYQPQRMSAYVQGIADNDGEDRFAEHLDDALDALAPSTAETPYPDDPVGTAARLVAPLDLDPTDDDILQSWVLSAITVHQVPVDKVRNTLEGVLWSQPPRNELGWRCVAAVEPLCVDT